MKKLLIALLTVVMVVSITLAGCTPTAPEAPPEEEEPPPEEEVTPPPEEEEPTAPEEEPPPPTPPKPGEWTITRWTGSSEFKVLTFTVSPFILITGYSYKYPGFWSGNLYTEQGSCSTFGPKYGEPITDSQFTDELRIPRGENLYWDLVFQGEFDETGTHASGTWEASVEGTPYAEGTWEASAPEAE